MATLKAAGQSPYPHKFHVTTSLTDYVKQYEETIGPGQILEDVVVSVAGLL